MRFAPNLLQRHRARRQEYFTCEYRKDCQRSEAEPTRIVSSSLSRGIAATKIAHAAYTAQVDRVFKRFEGLKSWHIGILDF
jgi:hypothetical protein